MPVYKLHYFNVRGRGETIRLIFLAAGQKFEDCRIEFQDWPNKKKDFKYGKLPVLDIDKEQLNQSVAIAHYLATQFGLAGKTPLDAAKCHAKVETIRDLIMPLLQKVGKEKDDAKKKEIIEKEAGPEFKTHLAMFEEGAKANPDKSGYLVAGQLTYADLEVHTVVTTALAWLGADLLKAYPTVQKHYDMISAHPKLKDYLASRPKTMI
jgi:glutathione S-transferase